MTTWALAAGDRRRGHRPDLLVLGPLFDSWGRKQMIAGTCIVSAVLLALSAVMFDAGILNAATQTIAWVIIFFFAGAIGPVFYGALIGNGSSKTARCAAVTASRRGAVARARSRVLRQDYPFWGDASLPRTRDARGCRSCRPAFVQRAGR